MLLLRIVIFYEKNYNIIVLRIKTSMKRKVKRRRFSFSEVVACRLDVIHAWCKQVVHQFTIVMKELQRYSKLLYFYFLCIL